MSTDSEHSNRLAGASSPYLLLHQHNPVDWYPWGEEALQRARREDKPIFLSVGYSTCYWCHVMERESFSDRDTAAMMNRDFINIKLDREERPDLDEIYMSATQLMTGHGGWPNSVFLTPRLEPFFAGTYFPPDDRPGLPSFQTILTSMADAWLTRREEVEEQAASVARAIRHHLGDRPPPAETMPGYEVVEHSVAALKRSFDAQWGGFGSAPKFPSPSNLLLLQELAGDGGDVTEMLVATLDGMARGGIFDQLGGGFHRYATDRQWNVPHFEKMLYDNGWLLEVYAREWGRSGDPQAARIVRTTASFVEREMTSPDGAFYSALDAETDGHEGAFYVWTRQDLLGVLGEEDFGFLAPLLGFAGPPFFEGDAYVLHLPERLERHAERRRMSVGQLTAEIEPLRRKLLQARSARRRPLTDDKVLTDWNGTAIAGLAESGRVLDEPALVEQAARAADFVVSRLRPSDGPLLHAWRDGQPHTPAMLGDYAYFVRGILALHRATRERRWLDVAVDLTREQTARLADPEGGFFISSAKADLLARSRDLFDGAVPGANAVAVLNLLDLAEVDPERGWGEAAERALRGFAPVISRVPEATRTLGVAILRLAGSGAAGASSRAEDAFGEAQSARVVTARLMDGENEAPGAFTIELEIADGWHIYGDNDASTGSGSWIPLRIDSAEARVTDLRIPTAETSSGEPPVHRGTVVIGGRVEPAGETPRLIVIFQACDEQRCLAPDEVVLEIPDTVG